ncbi:ATP-binding protein [Geodermatophilus sp. SYSU D00815]
MPLTSDARPSRGHPALRREIVAFISIALVVLTLVVAVTLVITDKIARDNAQREAERTVSRLATVLVEPLLTNVLRGEEEDRRDLDQILGVRKSDGSLTEVFVWTAQGQIVYSTDPAQVGRQITPTPELRAAIGGDVVSTIEEASEVDDDDVRAEPQLEVYVPIEAAEEQLALEAYLSASTIDDEAALLRSRAVPLTIGALLVLQLLQFPIAASMARRLTRNEAEQTDTVRRYLAASERERREIAADVHDGPVQDLAGVSYGLRALRPHLPERQQASLDRMVDALRSAVTSLRRLMIAIYPPDLSGPGLATAIQDLGERVKENLTVHVEAEALPEMRSEDAAVLYRTAREALANVVKHAQARNAWIRLQEADGPRGPAVRLLVEDDGVGLDEDSDELALNGHFGMRLICDRLAEHGGTAELRNRPEGGAVLEALLPVDGAADHP